MFKNLIWLPALILISCGGGEGTDEASTTGKNSITFISVDASGNETELEKIEGAAANEFTGETEKPARVFVRINEDVTTSKETFKKCLKEVTFSPDGFSSSKYGKCIEPDATYPDLNISAGRSLKTIDGVELYDYTFKVKLN